MRLDVNLASQPYEDARQFWLRWGTALAAIALLTLFMISLTISGWFAARRDRATISQLRSAIAERDATRKWAEDILNRPENRAMREQSQYLNELIDRKSFSWTRVFEDLEKVMPAGVHLVSINPEMDADNQLLLKLTVGGNSRDRAIDLARRMEDSKCFTQTQIVAEHQQQQSTTGDAERIEMNTIYVPCSALPSALPASDKAETPAGNSAKTSKRSES